jgi:hypothetical protein
MKAKALSPDYCQPGMTFRFVSNSHGTDFTESKGDVDAEDTLKMERSTLISPQMPAPLKSSLLAMNSNQMPAKRRH